MKKIYLERTLLSREPTRLKLDESGPVGLLDITGIDRKKMRALYKWVEERDPGFSFPLMGTF